MVTLSVILWVAACTALGQPSERVKPAPGPGDVSSTIVDLARVDVRGTAQSIALIARQVNELDAQTRGEVVASLRFLTANDPYTRAAMQLPFALQQGVMGISPEQLDPLVQRDWITLQEGLAAHVAVLETFGVEGPGPGDPLQVTAQLVHDLSSLAARIPPPTAALIEEHSDRMEQLTGVVRPCPRGPHAILPGQPWTLGMQLGGWHDALRRAQPFVTDPEAAVSVQAMIELLDAHAEAFWATAAR